MGPAALRRSARRGAPDTPREVPKVCPGEKFDMDSSRGRIPSWLRRLRGVVEPDPGTSRLAPPPMRKRDPRQEVCVAQAVPILAARTGTWMPSPRIGARARFARWVHTQQGSGLAMRTMDAREPSGNRGVRERCTPDCAPCTVDCAPFGTQRFSDGSGDGGVRPRAPCPVFCAPIPRGVIQHDAGTRHHKCPAQ